MQFISEVMSMKGNVLKKVANEPITEEMLRLVAGTSVKKEELEALRQLFTVQCQDIVETHVRDEFIDFYAQEIIKARKMGMKERLQEEQKRNPSAKFLNVMF